MEKDVFRFKQFSVRHSRSSMKVGVDAVLLGAWASHPNPNDILEVGCGCGVISLILSFRYPDAHILGIDIDEASVAESRENIQAACKEENVRAEILQFPEGLDVSGRYDLIVSNPPYFDSGISNPSTPREKARHQDTLSVFSLIAHGKTMLKEGGRLAMIFPVQFREEVRRYASQQGLKVVRECIIRDNAKRPEKRVMIELSPSKGNGGIEEHTERLTLFEGGAPTPEHRSLCGALYLKF